MGKSLLESSTVVICSAPSCATVALLLVHAKIKHRANISSKACQSLFWFLQTFNVHLSVGRGGRATPPHSARATALRHSHTSSFKEKEIMLCKQKRNYNGPSCPYWSVRPGVCGTIRAWLTASILRLMWEFLYFLSPSVTTTCQVFV